MTIRPLLACAVLGAVALTSTAIAQPAPAGAAKPEQAPVTRQALEDMNMAVTWLRRCPTERAYRRDAANAGELIISTFLHMDGMSEPEHIAIKEAGRKKGLAPCTDAASAQKAAQISARATIMLTASTPDAQRQGLLYMVYGTVDDSPCGVARGRAFAARPNPVIVQKEMARAASQISQQDVQIYGGAGISLAEALKPEVCKAQEKSKLGEGIISWGEMYVHMQDSEKQVETLSYGNRNSWIWRTEAQRGDSVLRPGGVYFPCRTYAPTLKTIPVYACELQIMAGTKALTAEVKPYCTDADCLKTVDRVELQLFADAKSTTPLATYAARPGKDGQWTFGSEVLRALLDPNNPALLVHVKVSGTKADGTAVVDALKLRGSPPDLELHDLQDAYSWAFAPASVSFTKH